jgi:hypothetical protein
MVGLGDKVVRGDSIQVVLFRRWSFSVAFTRKVYP